MSQETLSQKDRNMLRAAKKRWMEDKDNEQIANELDLSRNTIENYFSSEDMERFEEFFSEEEKQFLKIQMKQRIEDGTNEAQNYISKAVSHERTRPATFVKAAKEAQKIPERYIKMMQELGVIQKPKERKEVENKASTENHRKELAELMKEKQEGEKQDD